MVGIKFTIDLELCNSAKEVNLLLSTLLKEYSGINFNPSLVQGLQGSENKDKLYEEYQIRKKSGGKREINVPIKLLKIAQQALLVFFSDNYEPHRAAFGFTKGKSIIANAKLHVKKKVIYTIDLKDFFPTITWQRLNGMFQSYPFNFSKESSRIISNLVTYKGVLPQGAPTSPYLSNMFCRRLDSKLLKYSIKQGLTYTRYADDLTFSTSEKFLPTEIILEIKKIIKSENLKINEQKERLMPFYKRQIVTGLLVNKKVNVKRRYIKSIKAVLHNVNNSGWYEQAKRQGALWTYSTYTNYVNKNISKTSFQKIIEKQKRKEIILNPRDQHTLSKNDIAIMNEASAVSYFQKVVEGKINFIGAVRGKDDKIFKNLKEKYELQVLLHHGDKRFNRQMDELKSKVIDFLENRKSYSVITEKLKGNEFQIEMLKLKKNIVEANWHQSNEEKTFLPLFYSSMLSPYKTAEFFRRFRDDNFFGGLIHRKEGQLDNLEIAEIYANCKTYFQLFSWLMFLSNSIKKKFEKYLNSYESFIKKNPKTWPWDDEKFRNETIIPFRKEFRIENGSQATDLIDFLEKQTHREDFVKCNKRFMFPNDCKLIFTDAQSVKEAAILILYSMADNSNDDTINLEMTYVKNREGYNEVSLIIYDTNSIITKEPDLKILFSSKLRRAAELLRGLAEWDITAKFNDGCYYQFDVMKNNKVKLSNSVSGIQHKLIFYY